ncbi:MAG: D-glycero-beta-D-manno-heptose 1-phosphate adenylyltransferase [Lacibacter sp.]
MNISSYTHNKIMNVAQLQATISRCRLLSKKIVFTNGCFDILHAGHIHSLEQAAAFGDFLIVGLNSDKSINRIKGPDRPFNKEQDRALLLASLMMVDAVVLFEQETPLELIQTLKPDVLVKGGDYTIESIVGAEDVMQNGGKVEIIPLIPGVSTTLIADRIYRL